MKNKKSIKNVKQQKGLSLKKGSTSSKKILIITLISLGAIMILLGLLFFFREAIFVGKASYNQNLIGPNGFGIPLVGDYEVLPGDTNIELPIYADFGSQKTLLFEVKLSVDKNDYDNLERLKIGSNHNRVAPLSSSEITDAVNLGSLRDSTTLTRDSTTLTRDSTTLTRDSTTLTRDSSIPTIVSGSSVSKVELTSQFVVLPDNGCANAGNCPLTGKVSPVKVIFNVKSTASVGEIEVNLLEFKYYLEDGSIRSLDLAESINPAKVKVVTTTPAEDTGPHTHVVNDNIVCDEGYTTTKDLNAIRRLGGFPGCTDCAEGYVMENSLCVVPELTEDCATSADEDGDGEGSCRDSDCAGQQGSFNLPRERVRAICCQSDDDCSSGKVCGTSNACVASAALPPIEDCATSADEDGECVYSDLVLNYTFDDVSNGNVPDNSGNNYDGTLNGDMTCTETGFTGQSTDKACLFDGVDDEIEINYHSSMSGLSKITVEGWFKTSEEKNQLLVSRHAGITNGEWYLGMLNNGKLRFTVINFNNERVNCDQDVPEGTYYNDQWHYFVGTYDGSNMVLFYDGNYLGTCSQSGNIKSTSVKTVIGQYDGTEWYFNGTIDEVKIYSIAKNEQDIALDYDRFSPAEEEEEDEEEGESCLPIGDVDTYVDAAADLNGLGVLNADDVLALQYVLAVLSLDDDEDCGGAGQGTCDRFAEDGYYICKNGIIFSEAGNTCQEKVCSQIDGYTGYGNDNDLIGDVDTYVDAGAGLNGLGVLNADDVLALQYVLAVLSFDDDEDCGGAGQGTCDRFADDGYYICKNGLIYSEEDQRC